jgi:hypothetical protein
LIKLSEYFEKQAKSAVFSRITKTIEEEKEYEMDNRTGSIIDEDSRSILNKIFENSTVPNTFRKLHSNTESKRNSEISVPNYSSVKNRDSKEFKQGRLDFFVYNNQLNQNAKKENQELPPIGEQGKKHPVIKNIDKSLQKPPIVSSSKDDKAKATITQFFKPKPIEKMDCKDTNFSIDQSSQNSLMDFRSNSQVIKFTFLNKTLYIFFL